MKVALRNGIAVLVLVAVVYFVANYSGLIKEKVGVQGASTERAQEISGKLGSDVSGQVNVIASKAGEVKVNDIVGFFCEV